MHSENLFFHQSVLFFTEVEFFSLWGCNVHCCSQLHKNPCLLVKQKNIDHIYILQAGVSLCIKGFISLFQLQVFGRKNEQNRGGFFYCKVCYLSFKQNSCQKGVHFYRKIYAQQWCRPKRSDRNARALFAKMFDPWDFTPEQTLYCSDELFLKIGMRSVEL